MELIDNEQNIVDDPKGLAIIQEERSLDISCDTSDATPKMLADANDHASSNGAGPSRHHCDSPSMEDDPSPVEDTPLRCGMKRERISVVCSLVLGQGIALIATSMNATSFTLVHKFDVETQLFQLFWVYVIMSFHLLLGRADVLQPRRASEPATEPGLHTIPWLPPSLSPRLLVPWWVYLGMSILDVFPNFLTLVSFQYTSLTSTTLLGSLTVPATMIFSKLILSKTFHAHQYAGVAFCVIGGVLTIYMDASSLSHQPHSYIGDLMALSAAIAYGLGDTVAEYSVKRIDRFEYLGMLGFFGAILTGCSFPFIEWNAVLSLLASLHQLPVFGLLALYIVSVLAYYMTAAKFLVTSDATLLNLSMQTVNLWAVLFTWVSSIGDAPPRLFYISLVTVVVGVFTYELGCPCSNKRTGASVECRSEARHRHSPPVDYQTLAQRTLV